MDNSCFKKRMNMIADDGNVKINIFKIPGFHYFCGTCKTDVARFESQLWHTLNVVLPTHLKTSTDHTSACVIAMLYVSLTVI